ncbi:unnamed protein product [Cuscuta epithymum]|nr:unnamed protein product [Cuscuta epithymum]
MLHFLLQVAIRRSLPKHVAIPLIRLGSFFQKVCSKVLSTSELDQLELEITEVLCDLEEIFLPCFFDIMLHLPIHLVREIRFGGPVHYRWMYFMERYLCKLKTYVRNRSRPEGSIAEGYLIEECLTFCTRYLKTGANRKLHTAPNNPKQDANDDLTIFNVTGIPLGGMKRRKGKSFTLDDKTSKLAHRYVLHNSDSQELEDLIREHQDEVSRSKKRTRWATDLNRSNEFTYWLKDKVSYQTVSDNIFWLAKGPCPSAKRYSGYLVNGYHFYTKGRDERCKTQNSGVTLTAMTNSFASSKDNNPIIGDVVYYGAVLDIIELNYWSKFKIVLFRCEWYQVEKDDYGLTCVNSSKFCSLDDPFVLPSQVNQVFYVSDPINSDLCYVMERIPRNFFEVETQINEDTQNNYWQEPIDHRVQSFPCVVLDDIYLAREDLAPIILDAEAETVNVGQSSTAVENESEEEEDDTLWDWMHASDEEDY